MTNKKITDLVELTTPTTDDVFPLVDIATNSTKKAQLANLPISTATQTALDAKQATLVSGTNIKTINSTSLLGSGNISIAANPAGTAGQIQFSDGSAFAADSNLFWDNTNKRLGVGTSTPSSLLELKGTTADAKFVGSGSARLDLYPNFNTSPGYNVSLVSAYDNSKYFEIQKQGVAKMTFGGVGVGVGVINSTAQLQVKGSGSTSATTSLLVQNSSGTDLLKVQDDGNFKASAGANQYIENNSSYFLVKNSSEYHDTSLFALRFSYASMVLGGSSANASSILDVQSTTRGFLPPRMTTTQKNAISSPASGLIVYDTTTNKLCCYNGTSWNDLF